MDDNLLLAMICQVMGSVVFLRKKRKRWVNRRWWVRPINLLRTAQGDHNHLLQELKKDPDMFFKYTRMDERTFQELLELVSPFLQKHSIRTPLSPELRLAVTLRCVPIRTTLF